MAAKTPDESDPNKDWWADLHLHAFVSLTVADRKVERRELVWVKRFFDRYRKAGHYRRFVEMVEFDPSATFDPTTLASLSSVGLVEMTDGEKRTFINNLAQMCKAKGSISSEEYNNILEIADRVGVEDTDADAIINSVFSINDTFAAIVGLLALGVILKYTAVVVVPLVIAIFVSMIVRRVDRRVAKVLRVGRRLRWLRRLATMTVLFGVFFLVFMATAESGSEIAEKIPAYQEKFWSALYALDETATRLGLDFLSTAGLSEQLSALPIMGSVGSFLGSLFTFAGNFLLVVIFTGFLVFSTDRFAGAGQEIADKISAYLTIKSLMSLLTAAMVFLLCLGFGIDFALFWGTLAFLLNYVPSVGAIAASIPPVLLAVIQLETWTGVIFFAVILTSMHIGIGQILEPKLMGDKLAVNPIAILLGLIFWYFLWGIPGMFLAAPLMALLRIYSSHYNFSRGLEQLLAAD